MRSLIPLSLLLTIFESPVHGFVFPFNVHFSNRATPSSLTRRSPVPITNLGNAQYVANVSIAGQSARVLLDTGSSDLWVNFPGTVPTANMKDTGTSVTLSYAIGKASGRIQTAVVSVGNITVPDQAFLYVNDTSTFGTNIHTQGYDGLLGLGPNQGSVIHKKINKDSANTLLQRVFQANTSTENYITLLLNRKSDPGETFTGQFTISEILPGFENITSMPKLDVEEVSRLLKSDQHWQALTDKNVGIIGPDGLPIQAKSIVPSAPSGQFVAVVDSGFTFSQVPRDVSDAIYGRIRGATYDTQDEIWLVPCGQYLNVSINFGGHNYPVHPLDLVDDNFAQLDGSGKRVCIGAFQPITSAFSLFGSYDMILGMSFLRNAYTLLDFGDWIGESGDQDHPYMQLASIVDIAAARKDFVQVRLNGTDTISDAQWALLPADQQQHSPVSAEEKKQKYQEMILSRWPYIFVGCLVFVILVSGTVIWKCCCRRKAGVGKKGGLFSGKSKRSSYVPLQPQNQSVADLSGSYTPTNQHHHHPNPDYSQQQNYSYGHHTAYQGQP